jgi:hypothetical protein
VPGHLQTYLGWANGQPRKKEAGSTSFVLLAIRNPCLCKVFLDGSHDPTKNKKIKKNKK